jgi:hypothetical protein
MAIKKLELKNIRSNTSQRSPVLVLEYHVRLTKFSGAKGSNGTQFSTRVLNLGQHSSTRVDLQQRVLNLIDEGD